MNMRTVVQGVVLAVVGLNALGGGWYGIAGARDVPLAWLEQTPFASYLVPSVILLVAVGGSQLLATAAVIARARWARTAALAAAAILLGWITVQVAMIGYVSWLQPAMVVAALVELALAAPPATRRSRGGAGLGSASR